MKMNNIMSYKPLTAVIYHFQSVYKAMGHPIIWSLLLKSKSGAMIDTCDTFLFNSQATHSWQ